MMFTIKNTLQRTLVPVGLLSFFALGTAHGSIFEIKNTAADAATIKEVTGQSFGYGYDVLLKPDDGEASSAFIYGLNQSQNKLDVFKDDGQEDGRLTWVKALDDSTVVNGLVTGGVIAGSQALAVSDSGLYMLMGRMPQSGESGLYAAYRGDTTSSNGSPGAGLKLAQFEKSNGSPNYSPTEFSDVNVTSVKFVGNNHIIATGIDTANANKAVLIYLSGVTLKNDNATPKVTYQEIKKQFIDTQGVTQPIGLAIPKNTALKYVYVLNDDASDATKDAVLQFEKKGDVLEFKSKATVADPVAIESFRLGKEENIYVSSNALGSSKDQSGIVWLRYFDGSSGLNVFRDFINGQDGLPKIGKIGAIQLLGVRMLLAMSSDGSQSQNVSALRVVDKGSLQAFDANGSALDLYNGGQSVNGVQKPTTAVVGVNNEVIYVTGPSERGIARLTRSADLSISVKALSKKVEPGQTADFSVTLKNNGSNDVPALVINLSPSSAIIRVTGKNLGDCKESVSGPYTVCTQKLLKAGGSFQVTMSMLPRGIGEVALSAQAGSSYLEQKGEKRSVTDRATIKVGDYHNGTLSFSLWSLFGLFILGLVRRFP